MRRLSRAGFSLIELMIVIVLIGVVMTIAAPTWQKVRANTDLKSAAREIMNDLSNTKQRAITENLDVYRMTFNIGGNSYTLSRTDGVTAGTWTKSMASFGTSIVLNNVDFSGTVVSFRARGTVTNGSLVLRNGWGSSATITVNITGRTYVTYTMS